MQGRVFWLEKDIGKGFGHHGRIFYPWLQVAETAGLTVAIKGLKPGHLYQLEVCAINKEGIGPPIRTKDPIKAENPYG